MTHETDSKFMLVGNHAEVIPLVFGWLWWEVEGAVDLNWRKRLESCRH